jgi:hypothetical protein
MWNLEKDGTINKRFPGDFGTALDNKLWECSNCENIIPSDSNELFYVRQYHDLVYHRHSDHCLYCCNEKDRPIYAGIKIWEKPLEFVNKTVKIQDTVTEPKKINLFLP